MGYGGEVGVRRGWGGAYIVKDMGYWLDPLNRLFLLAFLIEIALPKCNVLKRILRKDTYHRSFSSFLLFF